MKYFKLLLWGFVLYSTSLIAKEVSVEDARLVAKNFFFQQSQTVNIADYEKTQFSVNFIDRAEVLNFYVFNIEGRDGFVVVSGQDFTRPILGYSDQNNVDFTNLSPELNFLLEGYRQQIKFGVDNNAVATESDLNQWQRLRMNTGSRTSVVSTAGPLIITTWNQSPYYNDQCPANSTGEKAVAGCVAVAMAQVMKYYNHPAQGNSSKSYYDNSGSVTHYANISYASQTYAWNNMPLNLNAANTEVAKLLYHCGHSTQMNWEVDGSGTQTSYVVTALKNYFKYNTSVIERDRTDWDGSNNYTDAQWEQMIRTEIDALRPIIYSGYDEAMAGHAWNCDGYQSDGGTGFLYHMNYGWGGYGNGYFALTNLVSGTTPGGETTYFDRGHQIIVNIMPASAYPQGCTGTRNITGKEGSIDDGSGNQQYPNNTDCYTLIQPSCTQGKVNANFERFDLSAGDYVEIYAGIDVNAPLLATIVGGEDPVGTTYESIEGGMLIHFVTNSAGQAGGWDLNYSSIACGTITTTNPQGTITDGSGTCNYNTGAACYWYIQPVGATQIVIDFTSFNVDSPDNDYVKIYAGTTSTTVATFKGTTPPTTPITVNSNKAIVYFRSYPESTNANVGAGWSFNYTSDVASGIKLVNLNEQSKVYPNPFVGDATVELTGLENQEVTLTLSNILGQTIGQKSFKNTQALYTVQLSELSNIPYGSGVYFLNIAASGESKTIKLVSE